MSETLENRKKRLLYQSWYRGCKETDKILGWFGREYLDSFSAEEVDAFEALLAEHDRDLFDWLTRKEPVPADMQSNSALQRLMQFDVAKILAEQNSDTNQNNA
jgi:antitoxin CptB